LTRAEWCARFGGEIPAAVLQWLRPGPRATHVPCALEDGCRQPHRVVQEGRARWFAAPLEPDCESFDVAEDALETFSIDHERMCRAVGEAFGLDAITFDPCRTHSAVIRIGDVAGRPVPCFLVLASSCGDFTSACEGLAARNVGPFVSLAPCEDHVTTEVRTMLGMCDAAAAALTTVLKFDVAGALRLASRLSDVLPKSSAPATPARPTGKARLAQGNTWPHARPSNPTWADVSMTFQLQEVHIRFGTAQGSFDYRDIDGFTDRRGGKRPNRLWTLLRALAAKNGQLPWCKKAEDPVRVRTLADLNCLLCRFFEIPGAPFFRVARENRISSRLKIYIKS
jgi:hypothetical protein